MERVANGDDLYLIFLGDYADRGNAEIKVLEMVLSLKLAYPKNVILMRGNHEEGKVVYPYDLLDTLKTKYGEKEGDDIHNAYVSLFKELSNVLVCANGIVAVHGGIPNNDIKGLSDIAGNEVAFGEMRWNDPAFNDKLSKAWAGSQERISGNRGGNSTRFGTNAFNKFMQAVGAKVMIRGHEYPREGYDLSFGGRLLTIFSNGTGSRESYYAGYVKPKFAIFDLSKPIEQINQGNIYDVTYNHKPNSPAAGTGHYMPKGFFANLNADNTPSIDKAIDERKVEEVFGEYTGRVKEETSIKVKFYALTTQPERSPPVFIHKRFEGGVLKVYLSREAYDLLKRIFTPEELLIVISAIARHEMKETQGKSHKEARIAQREARGYESVREKLEELQFSNEVDEETRLLADGKYYKERQNNGWVIENRIKQGAKREEVERLFNEIIDAIEDGAFKDSLLEKLQWFILYFESTYRYAPYGHMYNAAIETFKFFDWYKAGRKIAKILRGLLGGVLTEEERQLSGRIKELIDDINQSGLSRAIRKELITRLGGKGFKANPNLSDEEIEKLLGPAAAEKVEVDIDKLTPEQVGTMLSKLSPDQKGDLLWSLSPEERDKLYDSLSPAKQWEIFEEACRAMEEKIVAEEGDKYGKLGSTALRAEAEMRVLGNKGRLWERTEDCATSVIPNEIVRDRVDARLRRMQGIKPGDSYTVPRGLLFKVWNEEQAKWVKEEAEKMRQEGKSEEEISRFIKRE